MTKKQTLSYSNATLDISGKKLTISDGCFIDEVLLTKKQADIFYKIINILNVKANHIHLHDEFKMHLKRYLDLE